VLLQVLEESLRLLHPFLPFVTEEIYGMLPNAKGRLIAQAWPKGDGSRLTPALDVEFGTLKELVTLARTLRSEFLIAPEVKMPIDIKVGPGFQGKEFLERNAGLIALLANGPVPKFIDSGETKPQGALALAGRGYELYLHVRELVDTGKLVQKFGKDIDHEKAFAEKVRAKLANPAFVSSAPPEIVAKEREKCAEAESRAAKLARYIEELA
jgi:valyl-tRNA synthetase